MRIAGLGMTNTFPDKYAPALSRTEASILSWTFLGKAPRFAQSRNEATYASIEDIRHAIDQGIEQPCQHGIAPGVRAGGALAAASE